MAKISQQGSVVQKGTAGVESLWGFGDLCFNLPLIKAISEKHGVKVDVAVASRCKDALQNIPWVGNIHIAENLNHGIQLLKSAGIDHIYQITQNIKFYEFSSTDSNHSLIDTPLQTGRQIGLDDFDQKPIFKPTDAELNRMKHLAAGTKLIAVESVYNSIQSWASKKDIADLINAMRKKQKQHVLWLSNSGAPNTPYVYDMLKFTRRECICSLQYCDTFISVGSGFFCACLALPTNLQPKKIICLWKDDLYKYEKPLSNHQWHQNIQWVHNRKELEECISQL